MLKKLVDLIKTLRDLVRIASANPRGAQAATRLILAVVLLATLPSLLVIVMMLAR